VDDFDSTKHGFYVASNGSLTFANQTIFWRCPNNDESDHQVNNAAPFIYPPIGAIDDVSVPSDCTPVNITATRCQATSTSAFSIAPSGATTTATLTGGASALAQTSVTNFFTKAVIAAAGALMVRL